MNKANFKYLSVGQKIKVKITEVHPEWVIVSFKGQLLRVDNKTGLSFKNGNFIELLVKKVAPLKFAIPSSKGLNVWA